MSALPRPGERAPEAQRPALRLLAGARGANAAVEHQMPASSPQLPGEGPRILIAGPSESRRATVRREFARALPAGAHFAEAETVWDVLQRAPENQVVMLAGDLHDSSAESLTRILARRHPRLAVVVLDA